MSQTLSHAPGTNSTTTLNALVPPEGPKSIFIAFDFDASNRAEVDFTLATMSGKITAIQSLWIDNSLNVMPVAIEVQGTGQTITVPAGAQGTFPVIATNRPKFVLTYGDGVSGGDIVRSCWLNVPLPANIWFPFASRATLGINATGGIVGTGGTPVVVFANTPLAAGAVINPFNASESLFIDLVHPADTTSPGANSTTVELVPGQAFPLPANFGGVVSANAVTDGHVFAAWGVK